MIVAQDAPAKRIMDTTANPNPSTGESGGTTAQAGKPLVWYHGLEAIGKYMGFSALTILRLNQKQNFPLLRMPQERGQHWHYATNDVLIGLWFNAMAEQAYEHVARTAFGRKLRATRASKPSDSPAQCPTSSTPPSDSTLQPLDIATNLNHVL